MELRELVSALMTFNAMEARQWVADAMRAPIQWSAVGRPEGLNAEELAVAAGVAEMLAQRMGQRPPEWTQEVTESPRKIYLVGAAASMPRLRRLCEQESPEPLRRRQILAPPEFLTVA